MNKLKAFNYMASSFDIRESSNGWYRLNNPFDAKGGQTMGFNMDTDTVKCFRTGYKSSIQEFISLHSKTDWKKVPELVDKYTEVSYRAYVPLNRMVTKVTLPDHFYLLEENEPLQSLAIRFLESRNLDIDYLKDIGFGYCNDGPWVGRIVIPFIDPVLRYYIGRTFTNSEPKYLNPRNEDVGIGKSELFYNESALQGHRIFLCEGVFDALTCGPEGVATLGWSLSATQFSKIITAPIQEVYLVPDAGFYRKALVTAMRLMHYKDVYICNLDDRPGKDINDIGIDNVQFKKVKWNTFRESLAH